MASRGAGSPCTFCGRSLLDQQSPTGCGHLFCPDCLPRQRGTDCPRCCPAPQEMGRPGAEGGGSEKRGKREVRPMCEEHQEEVKLFCETERKMICVNCLDRRDERSHTAHNFMLINEAVDIYRAKINTIIYSLKQKKTSFEDIELKQQESISEIKEQSTRLQTVIDTEFAKLRIMLDEKEKTLVKELIEEKDDVLDKMENNLQEIRDNSQDTQQKLSYIEMQLNQPDGLNLLMENTSEEPSEDEYHPKITEGSLTMGAYQGPTQYRVWRHVIDIINPNCSAPTKRNAV